VGDYSVDPYYNIIHLGWPSDEFSWDPVSGSLSADEVQQIKNAVGSVGGSPDRKLGFSVQIPYFFHNNFDHYKKLLQTIFWVSEETDMPVLIGLDGLLWWRGRPDLWNWWETDASKLPGYDSQTNPCPGFDPDSDSCIKYDTNTGSCIEYSPDPDPCSGYDPENKKNTEWSSWDSSDALKYAWRNWGAPFQLEAPHPNLTSPVVIREAKAALAELASIIADWHEGLPDSKKYLFAGVKLAWELSIGVNWFYPTDETLCSPCYRNNGTQCTEDENDEEACYRIDGTLCNEDEYDNYKEDCTPWHNAHQVGYAAVKTAGIRTSGQITDEDLTKAVQIYMTEIAESAFAQGIPRRKIFSHIGVGGNSASSLAFVSADAALTPYANPGWSFYTWDAGPDGSDGSDGLPGLNDSLNEVLGSHWANGEWGGPGTRTEASWKTLYADFEKFRNNKIINAFPYVHLGNDESKYHAKALRGIIDQMGSWMNPPRTHSAIGNGTANLYWSAPSQAERLYLNVTSDPAIDVHGGFKVVNVANLDVTGFDNHVITGLEDGVYYWMLVADGKGRRVFSDQTSFEITSD
jgi:hypothetical protein